MIRQVKRAAPAVLLAALALAGCGGDIDPATTPAGRAQVEYLDDLYNGLFGQAYAVLHPVHKQIVSRSLFSSCAAGTIPVGQLDSIEVLDVFDDPVQISGTDERPAKAVRVRLTSTDGKSITFVNHEVKVGDRWYWVLNESAIAAYKAGRCPGGS
jgi:hypothetical protein